MRFGPRMQHLVYSQTSLIRIFFRINEISVLMKMYFYLLYVIRNVQDIQILVVWQCSFYWREAKLRPYAVPRRAQYARGERGVTLTSDVI